MFDTGPVTAPAAVAADVVPVIDIDSMAARFEQVKAELRRECGETAFRSWIFPVTALSAEAGVLTLAAPTRFVRDWVRTHYADRFRQIWQQQNPGASISRVDCVIGDTPAAARTAVPYESITVANENDVPSADDIGSPLDPRFTFDTFIAGPSNELARAAALRAAQSDTPGFNPLFLQGSVGLGKTHLMQAIAHGIRARKPQARVVYMSAEKFMYSFVRALRARDTMAFKEQLRNIDALMIDDIQFICGKESTQQEFFHTLNALMDQGRQVVLTADKAPGDLEGMDERLRSRLGMGLVVNIQPPSAALRLAILRARCAQMGQDVPEDVLAFLADKITASVRELEGALNRLIAQSELIGRDVTLETATDLLQDLLRAQTRRISVEEIQKRVAEHYNIRTSDILSPRRARPVARPRQVAMYLSKALTQHSLPDIGRKFGGRDHTTIIHGIRKIEELMAAGDISLRSDIDLLRQSLTA